MAVPDTYYPWMDKIEAHMVNVLADARAAGVMDTDGQVIAFDEWPESLNGYPLLLIGLDDPAPDYSASMTKVFYKGPIRVFCPGITLAAAQKILYPLIHFVWRELATDLTLDGTVNHIHLATEGGTPITGVGQIKYGGVDVPGFVVMYDVKVDESAGLTVAP